MTLSELRKEKSLTTVDLAVRLGISQGHYSNLERGKKAFNPTLLKRTAKLLGVSTQVIQEAVQSHPVESHKLRSWMSSIKIHGLPLIKAFEYYLDSHGIDVHSLDDPKLKKAIKEFVVSNIGYSVLAELSENKALLHHIREHITMDKDFAKNHSSSNKTKSIQ